MIRSLEDKGGIKSPAVCAVVSTGVETAGTPRSSLSLQPVAVIIVMCPCDNESIRGTLKTF